MRLTGGTGALVRALAQNLPEGMLQLGAQVVSLALGEADITLRICRDDPEHDVMKAKHVIAAIPPRLLQATIGFLPGLNPAVARHWRDAATWMAPHAKIFALYDRPFWRDAGLSGTAQSMVGPLVEIHDATKASGAAALFGFCGIGADHRARLGEAALTQVYLEQLARLFGPPAGTPSGTLFKDWAVDPRTATDDDRNATGHPRATACAGLSRHGGNASRSPAARPARQPPATWRAPSMRQSVRSKMPCKGSSSWQTAAEEVDGRRT